MLLKVHFSLRAFVAVAWLVIIFLLVCLIVSDFRIEFFISCDLGEIGTPGLPD